MQKNCADCSWCTLKLMKPENVTGRQLAESTTTLFDNSRVMKISCGLDKWGGKTFTSMKVFETSGLPISAAENCKWFDGEEE